MVIRNPQTAPLRRSFSWLDLIVIAVTDWFLCRPADQTSMARIKRLRGVSRPQFRLRVRDVRVFYDVVDTEVHILAIVSKEHAEDWLRGSLPRRIGLSIALSTIRDFFAGSLKHVAVSLLGRGSRSKRLIYKDRVVGF